MKDKKDSVQGTMIVTVALCVVCSVVVSFAAVSLRPTQEINKVLDKKKNILEAAGLYKEGADIKGLYDQYVRERIVTLATGEYNPDLDTATFNQRKSAKDPSTSVAIPSREDFAGIKRRSNDAFVYEIVNDQGSLDQIVLPVHGKGLWSTLYGFMAISSDQRVVNGLGFYEHAETPGLGGEVDNPMWKASWRGKKLFDDDWEVKLTVLKGKVDKSSASADYQIDGLSGSTITTRGLDGMVKYWIGPAGFGRYLARLRTGGAANG